MGGIVVVGSLNMDLVLAVPRIPAPGETLLGEGFAMLPGGKGANQAYAAARLAGEGTHVAMAGKVGADVFGERLRNNLAAVGVNVAAVGESQREATGVATITVDAAGQNAIVVAPGANFDWTVEEAERLAPLFAGASYAMFQLETPLAVVEALLKIALEAGARTILDPAPAQRLGREMLQLASILTPNETEARLLVGEGPGTVALAEAAGLAARLQAAGARDVLVKLGEKGSVYLREGVAVSEALHVPAFAVEAVDTTAAGDTFNAGLAVALAEGEPLEAAIRFASAAAGLSVTRRGAQASAPGRDEVVAYLASA